jgi:hypothetical protein
MGNNMSAHLGIYDISLYKSNIQIVSEIGVLSNVADVGEWVPEREIGVSEVMTRSFEKLCF